MASFPLNLIRINPNWTRMDISVIGHLQIFMCHVPFSVHWVRFRYIMCLYVYWIIYQLPNTLLHPIFCIGESEGLSPTPRLPPKRRIEPIILFITILLWYIILWLLIYPQFQFHALSDSHIRTNSHDSVCVLLLIRTTWTTVRLACKAQRIWWVQFHPQSCYVS